MKCTSARSAHLRGASGVGVLTVLLPLFLLSAGLAYSQDLRAIDIERQQAEKAKHLSKYTPTRAEAVAVRIEDYLSAPHGFYPLVGSVYSSGGMAFGAGYRQYYGDYAFFDLKGLYSIRDYKRFELSTDAPGDPSNRLKLHARVGWLDATRVAFYGIGSQTSEDDKTNFRFQNFYTGGGALIKPVFPLAFSAGLTYEDYETRRGLGQDPSIETQFLPAEVPGLGANPAFIHSRASAGIDSRPTPGYARRGGLYEAGYHNFHDRDEVYSFDRLDGEVIQHIPLYREKYVISLRGRVETVLGDDDVVPYFLLPALGGGGSLRGFPSWRFRDRHSLLMQAEWRWAPNRAGMDMALFFDAGKVSGRREDLDLQDLKSDAGIGIRLHGSAATFLRLDLAHGNEGLGFVFAGSGAF